MNRLFNPALLIALGFHALLLAIPLSGDSKFGEGEKTAEAKPGNAEPAASPSPQATSEQPSLPSPAPKLAAGAKPAQLLEADAKPKTTRSPSASKAPVNKKPTVEADAKPPARSRRQSPARSQRQQTQTTARTQSTSNRPAQTSQTSRTNSTTTTTTNTSRPNTVPTFSSSSTPPTTPPTTTRTTPSPSPQTPPASQSVALNLPPVIRDPFSSFPFYPFEQSLRGSLELLPSERDRDSVLTLPARTLYAFNTRADINTVSEFYTTEVPKNEFKALEEIKTEQEGEGENAKLTLKIYKVTPKEGSESRYLHLIPFEGRTVILLSPEQITDVESLKTVARERLAAQRQRLASLSSNGVEQKSTCSPRFSVAALSRFWLHFSQAGSRGCAQ
jgi:hypothetical protein